MLKKLLFMSLFSTCLLWGLSLEKAKELALKNNLDIEIQNYNYQLREKDLNNAYYSFLPKATISGAYTIYSPSIEIGPKLNKKNQQGLGLAITQPLFLGGKIWFGLDIAENQLKQAKLSQKKQIIQTINSVEASYYNCRLAKKSLLILKEQYDLSSQNAKKAYTRYQTGLISESDYLNFKKEVSFKKNDYNNQKNNYQTSLLQLQNLLNIPQEINSVDSINFKQYARIINKLKDISQDYYQELITAAQKRAFRENQDLNLLKLSGDNLDIQKKLKNYDFLPTINLSYNLDYSKNNLTDDFSDAGFYRLSASLPIFPILDKISNRQKAEINLKKHKTSLGSYQNSLNLQIKSTINKLINKANSLETSQISVKIAKNYQKLLKVKYDNNLVSSSDYLESLTNLRLGYLSLYQNQFDFLKAKAELKLLLGMMTDQEFFELILNPEKIYNKTIKEDQ